MPPVRLAVLRAVPACLAVPMLALTIVGALGLTGCEDDPPAQPLDAVIVPDEFPTPQAAMDAAEPGQKVFIRPGVYTATEVRDVDPLRYPHGVRAALFVKEGVEVEGLGDALGEVVLRDTTASDTTMGIVLAVNTQQTWVYNLVVEGFGTGVFVFRGSGGIFSIHATDAVTGIRLEEAGIPNVVGNLVTRCDVGISERLTTRAQFDSNQARDCDIGFESTTLSGSLFVRNILCRNRVGMRMADRDSAAVGYNVFQDNSETGILVEDGADPLIILNDFYDEPVAVEARGYEAGDPDTVWVSECFWGNIDLEGIAGRVLDATDEAWRGVIVEFKPVSPIKKFPLAVDLERACGEELPTAPGSRRGFRSYAGSGPSSSPSSYRSSSPPFSR